jgi:hypothetical protein
MIPLALDILEKYEISVREKNIKRGMKKRGKMFKKKKNGRKKKGENEVKRVYTKGTKM